MPSSPGFEIEPMHQRNDGQDNNEINKMDKIHLLDIDP